MASCVSVSSSIGETNIPMDITMTEEQVPMLDSIDDSAARRGTASLEDKGPVSTGEVKGRKTSIWEHFSKIVKEGTQKPEGAKCNYCERKYAWVSGNGTSTSRKHLKVCPKNPTNKVTNKK
ncbi:hypothetical protein Dimus_030298 [Dionaea muscipula]